MIISRKQTSFYTVRTGRSVSGIQRTAWSPALDAPRLWMGNSSNHTLTKTWKLGVQTPQGWGYNLSHQVHNLDQQKDWLKVGGIQSEVREQKNQVMETRIRAFTLTAAEVMVAYLIHMPAVQFFPLGNCDQPPSNSVTRQMHE